MERNLRRWPFMAALAGLITVATAEAAPARYTLDEAFRGAVFSHCSGAPYSITHTQHGHNQAVYNVTCGYNAFSTRRIIIHCRAEPTRSGATLYVCR